MSKKKQVLSYWCWDLDYVQQTGKWELIRYVPKSFENALDDKECGTIVIWRHLDRVGLSAAKGTQAKGEDKFSEAVNLIDKHLSMIFHRFIEKKIVTVYCWGRAIRAWNPFAELQAATQACPPEQLHNEPEVQVQGYILPHKSKLNEKDHSYLGGTRGWGAQQGFYVYRGERLLVAGDWLGFFRKEDHYKLVRIRIDLPNHLDDQWQIDIRKSQARPPANTKEQLSNYAKSVRKKGVDVFRHRGNYVARISKKSDMLWLEQKKDNQYGYVINMEHSVIQQFLNRHSSVSAHKLQSLFALISECVPVKTIYMNEVDQGVGHKSKLKAAASIACRENFEAICVQLKEDGLTSKEIRYRLSDIEPFFHYPELLDEIDL